MVLVLKRGSCKPFDGTSCSTIRLFKVEREIGCGVW